VIYVLCGRNLGTGTSREKRGRKIPEKTTLGIRDLYVLGKKETHGRVMEENPISEKLNKDGLHQFMNNKTDLAEEFSEGGDATPFRGKV